MASPNKRIQARAKARRLSGGSPPYWDIRNAGNRTVELTIYGLIGESLLEAGVGARAIREELSAFENLAVIEGFINSPGGSVSEGLTIYNILRDYREAGVEVRMTVQGFANSIASVIPQAASPGALTMGVGSMMMIHDPTLAFNGTSADLRKAADVLDEAKKSLTDIYHRENRKGASRRDIESWMSAETWWGADAAVAEGFADSVANGVESEQYIAAVSVSFNPAMYGSFDRMAAARVAPPWEPVAEVTEVMATKIAAPAAEETAMVEETTAAATETPAPAPVLQIDDFRKLLREEMSEIRKNEGAEHTRVKAVTDLFDGMSSAVPGIENVRNKALADGCNEVQAKAAIYDFINGEPSANIESGGHTVPSGADIRAGGQDGGKLRLEGMSQAMMARGMPGTVKRDPQNQFNGLTLIDVARECLKNSGETLRNDRQWIIRNAFTHSRSDFPALLEDTVNKSVLLGWEAAPETWRIWTSPMFMSDYRTHSMPNLEHFSNLTIVRAGGEYEYGTIGEAKEEIIVAKYGKLFSIDEETMVNDSQSSLTAVPMAMGAAAALVPGDLAYGVLTAQSGAGPNMSDDNPLFHSVTHKNVAGAGAFGEATVTEMDQLMSLQVSKTKNAEGIAQGPSALNISPAYLIVPRALKLSAQKLMSSAVELGASNAEPNSVQNLATVVTDARLDVNGNKTRHYMAASPASGMTVRVGFLDGLDAPQTAEQGGFSIDGVTYKVRIVCGVAPADWRGMTVAPGV